MTTSINLITPPSELLELIESVRRPLLIAHISPDGDAIGSLLAAGILLHHLGKEPLLACQDRVPVALRFLPFQDQIKSDVRDFDPDVVFAVDSSDPSRMGAIYDPDRFYSVPLVVIDHHVTNVHFGDMNWVEPSCCATAEMIYYLMRALDVTPTKELASCLLTGLVTDTRGFRTANTTARVMGIASDLMEAGAALNRITEHALNSRSYDLISLWGRVLGTVQRDGGIISVSNERAMREDLNGIIRADGVVSFILGAYTAKVAVVFTELPEGKIECSFRARPGSDVATIALQLGGGGHPLASGCTVEGTLPDVRRQVVALLRKTNALAE